MNRLSVLRRLPPLGLIVVLALSGCASTNGSSDLSPAAQRGLVDAMAGQGPGGIDAATLDALRVAALAAPHDAVAQERYGLAAEQVRLYPEAMAALDRALSAAGQTPALLLEKGRVALEMADVPAAARAYRQVLAVDPDSVDALSGLGVTEDLDHHHAEAQVRYQRALTLAPADWGVRSNLALSLLMSGNAAQAVEALKDAAHDRTAPRRARHDLALALVAAGERDRAIGVLRTDVSASQARELADEFAGFAAWLANPSGSPPTVK